MKKVRDHIILILLLAVAVVVSLVFETNFLTSVFLFLGLPSLFLILCGAKPWRRILGTVFLGGLLYGFILDYFAELNGAWSWIGSTQPVFVYKILGVVTIDVMIWFVLWSLFIVLYYEHFIERDKEDFLSPRYKKAVVVGFVILAAVVASSIWAPDLWKLPYAYLFMGLVFGLPILVFTTYKRRTLLVKFLKATPFLCLVFLTYELTAVHLDQWKFPGQYIGTMQFGSVMFPVEEFVFWIVLSGAIVLSYYELLIDDFE